MENLIITLVIVLIVVFFIKLANTVYIVHGHWQHYYENFSYSTQDFYELVEKLVQEKGIPNLNLSRVEYYESGYFSAKRQYLRIERDDIVFDICAAPFADDFFISSWRGELPDFFRKFINAIPGIGGIIVNLLYRETYYQIDTEGMFASCVHNCVLDAIKQITEGKGMRDLTELERQFNRIGK